MSHCNGHRYSHINSQCSTLLIHIKVDVEPTHGRKGVWHNTGFLRQLARQPDAVSVRVALFAERLVGPSNQAFETVTAAVDYAGMDKRISSA